MRRVIAIVIWSAGMIAIWLAGQAIMTARVFGDAFAWGFGSVFDLKVDLFLHKQGMDTTTPAGRMLFQMCGVFAKFERAMISERVRAGLERVRANAPAKGKKAIGRPPNDDPTLAERIRAMRAEGTGLLKIARTLGIGTGLVQRIVTAGPD